MIRKIMVGVAIFLLITTIICGFSLAGQAETAQSSVVFHGVYASFTAAFCVITFFVWGKAK